MPFYGLGAPLLRPMELLTQPAPGLEHVRPWRVGMRWREPHWCGWNLGISKRHWTKLVGGLEHECYFSIIYGIILNIFQRGWSHQPAKECILSLRPRHCRFIQSKASCAWELEEWLDQRRDLLKIPNFLGKPIAEEFSRVNFPRDNAHGNHLLRFA